MLSVQSYENIEAYDWTQLRLLQAVANQAATALHNAKMYEEAEAERNKLAAILNSTTDAVVVLNQEEHVALVNPAAERHLQVSVQDVVDHPLSALGLKGLSRALDEAKREMTGVTREVATPQGRCLYASVSPVSHLGWVIVMQDVTPLKELDRMRTEWVASVSHDMKNPVTAIGITADLLERSASLNENQQELLRTIRQTSKQLRSMVTDVLDLARLEADPALKETLVEPNQVVGDAIAEIRPVADSKSITLITDLPPRLPAIRGDETQPRRSFVNLLSNAMKHTDTGGRVIARGRPRDSLVQSAVSDTGRGIPEQELPQIFDRFYRVSGSDQVPEGTGLGLSIVKRIIEKHGGCIWVESELGRAVPSSSLCLTPGARVRRKCDPAQA